MKTLVDKLNEVIEYRTNVKLAALKEAYDGDDERKVNFSNALDFIEKQIKEGALPAIEADIAIDLAAALVEDKMAQKKASQEDGSEKLAAADIQELEGFRALGEITSTLLKEGNIDPAKLLSLTSEADIKLAADQCGKILAQHLVKSNLV